MNESMMFGYWKFCKLHYNESKKLITSKSNIDPTFLLKPWEKGWSWNFIKFIQLKSYIIYTCISSKTFKSLKLNHENPRNFTNRNEHPNQTTNHSKNSYTIIPWCLRKKNTVVVVVVVDHQLYLERHRHHQHEATESFSRKA